MWLTGLDRVRRFVNRAYVEFLGVGYEAAVAFDWRTIQHPDDHDRIDGWFGADEHRCHGQHRRDDGGAGDDSRRR